MNEVSNRLLIDFPGEIQQQIVQYLTINDLNNCSRVSHLWKNLFDSDLMWEPIAKKMGIKKLDISLMHQFVIETPSLFNWFPNFLKCYLSNDYKFLIKKKIVLEEEKIKKKYPKEFLQIFNGPKAIQRLPAIEINLNEMICIHNGYRHFYYFKDEYFSSPIQRVILKIDHNSEIYFVLFKIINNKTGEIYRDAISFFSFANERFFNIDHTRPNQRIIFPRYYNVTKEKLNRLQRLINREPVGIIINETRDTFVEGEQMISNGKSVLELY